MIGPRKIKAEHQITRENVDSILQQALVEVFDQVLECAGVFKNNKDGEAGWQKIYQGFSKRGR